MQVIMSYESYKALLKTLGWTVKQIKVHMIELDKDKVDEEISLVEAWKDVKIANEWST